MIIRQCTADDIPWLLALSELAYRKTDYGDFNATAAKGWLVKYIDNPRVLCVRGKETAALAQVNPVFWKPEEKTCELQFLASTGTKNAAFELLKILEFINELRKKSGCATFWINSRIADLEPLAKRLGARLIAKSYLVEN